MNQILEPIKDIALVISENPALAILDSEKFEAFYEKIKAETETIEADISTNKGRDEIRSMAFKVAKTRTAIDKARLGLTEDWRTKTKQANDAGTKIKLRLEELEEKVRAPLTEWEKIEKERSEKHQAVLDFLKRSTFIEIDDNSDLISTRINNIMACVLDPEIHGVAFDIVNDEKSRTLTLLNSAFERVKIEEKERAELERFRAEAAEREAAEAVKRAEKEEQERIEKIRFEAIENAKIEQERKHKEELEAERERADKAERQAKEEAQRKADEEAGLQAAQLVREQDREHRSKVLGAAKAAIMECGIDEAKAREIVLAIAAGSIPAVSIKF